VVLPQAVLRVIPVYKNQMVALIKATSIIGYVAIMDITKTSDIIRSRTFDAFFPLLLTALIYLILSWLAGLAINALERRLTPKHREI
jgi:polar amino acid transport system substrate-binding protein